MEKGYRQGQDFLHTSVMFLSVPHARTLLVARS